jgi:SAM-dependent methyltransferase
VVALDGSQAAVARAPVSGVVADAMSLPFMKGAFDCVVDVVCIAHNRLEDAKKIISEIVRVLKPGGKIFSVLPTSACWDRPYKGKGHVMFPAYYQVQQLFNKHFELEINWSAFSDGSKTIEHWLVSGTKKPGD